MRYLRGMRRAACVFALSIAACSGNDKDPASDAAGAFVGAGAPDCPRTDPGVGAPCANDGLRCEYGADFNPACNTWLTCAQGGWRTTTLNGVRDPVCPTTTAPTAPPNPAECPASAPRTSDACPAALACNYEDTSCSCSKGFWNCDKSRLFCKTPRPRIGTPCNAFDECVIAMLGPCDRIVLTCGRESTWTASKSICL
jgi:hypothetical protein